MFVVAALRSYQHAVLSCYAINKNKNIPWGSENILILDSAMN
jgi:hypothetical protein